MYIQYKNKKQISSPVLSTQFVATSQHEFFLTRHRFFIAYKSQHNILPSPPPTWGRDSTHIIVYYYNVIVCFHSLIVHTHCYLVTALIYYIISINFTCYQMFEFGFLSLFFGLCTLVWKNEYNIVLCYIPLILGRHVFGVWESCLSPPGHAPPARRPYFLEYCINTCAYVGVT